MLRPKIESKTTSSSTGNRTTASPSLEANWTLTIFCTKFSNYTRKRHPYLSMKCKWTYPYDFKLTMKTDLCLFLRVDLADQILHQLLVLVIKAQIVLPFLMMNLMLKYCPTKVLPLAGVDTLLSPINSPNNSQASTRPSLGATNTCNKCSKAWTKSSSSKMQLVKTQDRAGVGVSQQCSSSLRAMITMGWVSCVKLV